MDKSIVMDDLKRGDFQWKDGIPDTEVIFVENENGRFLLSWDENYGRQQIIFK